MGGRAGHIGVAVILLVVIVSSGMIGATSTPSYVIDAATSIDTPTRTLTVEGDEYNVSSLGVIKEGETLQVDVARPGDGIFTVYLYNIDREIVDSVRRTENGTYSLDTNSLAPGTYVAALDIDGTIQAIQPVVVDGHDFSVDAPSSVSPGESISVTASVSNTPYQVDVVLYNGSWSTTATAARIGDGRYNRIIDENLAPGEYTLYVVARGEDSFDGKNEITGLSSTQTITVEGTTEPTTTQDPTASATTTPPTTSPPTTISPTTQAATTSATSTTKDPSTTRQSTVSTTPAPTASPTTINATTTRPPTVTTTDTASVITPGTSPPTTSTSTTTPGFTIGTAFAALSLLIYRQR